MGLSLDVLMAFDASDQLRDKRVELILQQLEQLPTLPPIAVRVLELTGQDDSSASQVVKLLTSDASLSARILQLLHRSDAGVSPEISSVDRAVVLLGFEAVRGAVLALSVFQAFGDQSPLAGTHFDRGEFWKHCVAVACCAQLLAKSSGVDEGDAFLCGLLHDLGKIALDAALPKSFSRVVEASELLRTNIGQIERSVIGLDHNVAGKRLAERWGLPSAVRDCIWLHGQLPEALPATTKNPKLVNLITLADHLVRERHLGYSGNYTFPIPLSSLLQATGLSSEQIEQMMSRLVEEVEFRAAALGLDESSSAGLYQQAMAQANRELARVSGQLAARNQKLAIRSRFFEVMSEFYGQLRPDAPMDSILRAIGHNACGSLGVPIAAAFSLAPGAAFAELILFRADGQVVEQSLVDCPAHPPAPLAGDGPILSAGAETEWLISAISPRLAADRRYWICLESDHACIGGVVWGAREGEATRLASQAQEIASLAAGWALAMRTAQIRDQSRTLAEQLAAANSQLQVAQTQIVRSKMMISVGEMAAGAAHEMNNPLAVISGRSQMLANQLTEARHQAMARLIFEQSHRLSEIISELMDFAKPEPPSPQAADVADLLQGALHEAKMLSELADRTVELTLSEMPEVLVDAQQVRGALQEIIENAIQATDPVKGTIDLHATYDSISRHCVITVSDNGGGMDDQTLKRAFDPFFSAKRAGRRRGMGLAKALRWIEASGGSIRLESRPGQGTRSTILLPAQASPWPGERAPDQRAAQ